MDTKNQSTTKIPAVRTFAKDLELGRKNKKPSTGSRESDSKIKTGPIESRTDKAVPAEKKESEAVAPAVKSTVAADLKKPLTVNNKKTGPTIPRRDTFIVENEDSAAATIITDTKHNRFKLAPAIKSSLSGWFTSKKDSYKASKIPKYTVPETTLRKGVIQKATSNTGRLTTSDFSSIHERIRDRKERESQQAITTTWTANTEPGFLLLENSSHNVANVQATTRRSFRTSPQEIVVTKINRNKIATVSETTPKQEFESPIVPFVESAEEVTTAEISSEISAVVPANAPTPTTEEVYPAPEPIVNIEEPAFTSEERIEPVEQTSTYEIIEPAPQEEIFTPEETYPEVPENNNQNNAPRWESEMPAGYSPAEIVEDVVSPSPEYISPNTTETYPEIPTEQPYPTETEIPLTEQPEPVKESLIVEIKKRGILSLNTNILTLSASGFALLILIIVGSSYLWYSNQSDNISTSTSKTEITQIINLPLEKVAVDESGESIQDALMKVRNEKNESSQVVFLTGQPSYDPLPPNTILSALDIYLEQNFVRSISAIRFGFTRDKQPFVIIKTSNENAAKGGMLMWEMGMYEDLAEIFSLTTVTRPTKFTDSSLNETDLRVLKNEAGAEQIIYGIKNNTVIITTNIFNFSELSRLISK